MAGRRVTEDLVVIMVNWSGHKLHKWVSVVRSELVCVQSARTF